MQALYSYLSSAEKMQIDELTKGQQISPYLAEALKIVGNLKLPCDSIRALISYSLAIDSVSEQVDGMVERLLSLKSSEELAASDENEKDIYRELFVTLGSSIDVILLKLAIELAKLRLDKAKNENEHVRSLAKMSQDIYAPLCHRLGLGEMKTEFEDLSLYVLDKDTFFEIAKKLQLKKTERERLVSEMIDNINLQLADTITKYQIFGRSKHIYSIYNKLKKFDKKYEDLYDLLAIRIICQTEVECYTALGLIHQIYPPIDKRFKDYIARPKPNMYQSLHTSVKGEDGHIFEIQIRTEAMDSVAEQGVAAHVAYKEGTNAVQNNVAKQLASLKEFVAYTEFEAEDYKQLLAQNILDDHVYAFTPARKIIALPQGATVIDFAFKIHTKVGERMVGAKVNDKIASYSQTLMTNDVVEILTKQNAPGPNEMWLEQCITSHARSKIKNYLRRKQEIENETTYDRGRELLYAELKKRNLERTFLDDNKRRNELLKHYKYSSIYDAFESIADHRISASELIDFFQREKTHDKPKEIKFVTSTNNNSVIIPGAEDIKYELAKCCNPVYGDEIVARAKNGVAFKVHRCVCNQIGNNYLPAKWNATSANKNKYNAKIKVIAFNNDSLLNDIINMLSTSNVGVVDFRKNQSGDIISMTIMISVYDIAHIDVAIANIQKNNLVKDIQRI